MKNITKATALSSLLLLNACNESKVSETKESQTTTATEETTKTTLKEKLETRASKSGNNGNPTVRKAYNAGIDAVANSGILDRALKTGDTAPDFTLNDANGTPVTLSELLKNGPVVLTWYRGGWCPYCNIALKALQEELPNFKASGAQLVALTPELPDHSLDTLKTNFLEYDVLTDLNHKIAKEYKIVFSLTPEVSKLYKEKFDLTEFNGTDAGDFELPLAATYIIGTDGKIKWHFLEADYKKRAEPSDIIEQLNKL